MLFIPPGFLDITPAYVAVPDIQPVASGSLMHHWVAASGSGVEVPDVIGHVDGALIGGATYSTDRPPLLKWKTGNSISVGISYTNRMECSPLQTLDTTNPWTIMFWANVIASSVSGMLCQFVTDTGVASPLEIRVEGTSNPLLFGSFDNNNMIQISSSSNFTMDTWTHVAIVYTGNSDAERIIQGNYKLYFDGTLDSVGAPSNVWVSGAQANRFGGRPEEPSAITNAKLDDIRIYNSGLSASEIKTINLGYNNIWTNGSGDNLWATDDNWPLNGVPQSGDAVLFSGAYPDDCNTESTRIRINELCVPAGYTGVLDIAGSFLTISSGCTINDSELQVGGTMQVGGNLILSPTTYTEVYRELIDLVGVSGEPSVNITVPSTIGRFTMNAPGTTKVFQNSFSCNSMEIKGGSLDLNENNITVSGDVTMRGGGTIDFDNTTTTITDGNCKLYGNGVSSRVALNPSNPWIVNFVNTTGVSFLIRNAIVNNLTASGIAAECINCVTG